MLSTLHIATNSNTNGSVTRLDHPLLNGNIDAIIIVTPLQRQAAQLLPLSPLGVAYDGERWSIVCINGSSIPLGASFSVLMFPGSHRNLCFVHRCTSTNTIANSTAIDDPNLNGAAGAVLFVTPRLTASFTTTRYPDVGQFGHPGPFVTDYGVAGWIKALDGGAVPLTSLSHYFGVWFNERTSRWDIFHQDWQSVPLRAEFNVVRLDGSNYGSSGERVRVAISAGGVNGVDFACEPPNFDGVLFIVTPNISFWHTSAVVHGDRRLRSIPCDFPFGVRRRNPREDLASVFNLRGEEIPPGVGFNVRHESSRG